MLEGYRVLAAKNDREVLKCIDQEAPDLLILDLEIPYTGGLAVLEILRHRKPQIPVVIHTFLTDTTNHLATANEALVVEKVGNTDCLKTAILEMLWKFYPHRVGEMAEDKMQRREASHDEE